MRFKQNHEYFALAEVLTVVVLFLTVSTALAQAGTRQKKRKNPFFLLERGQIESRDIRNVTPSFFSILANPRDGLEKV